MLSKKQRIDTKRFNEIITSGRNIGSGAIYFKFLPNEISRFAVVVSKKVAKSAIKRHFIKRRLFKAIKGNFESFPVGDYIVFANKNILDMEYSEINNLLRDNQTTIISRL